MFTHTWHNMRFIMWTATCYTTVWWGSVLYNGGELWLTVWTRLNIRHGIDLVVDCSKKPTQQQKQFIVEENWQQKIHDIIYRFGKIHAKSLRREKARPSLWPQKYQYHLYLRPLTIVWAPKEMISLKRSPQQILICNEPSTPQTPQKRPLHISICWGRPF